MLDYDSVDVYEFDVPFRVFADGGHEPTSGGVYAPDVDGDDLHVPGWSTVTDGCSGQDGYSGPVMHSSEFIGEGLSDYVREVPGVYVVCVAWFANDSDDGVDADGWLILRRND